VTASSSLLVTSELAIVVLLRFRRTSSAASQSSTCHSLLDTNLRPSAGRNHACTRIRTALGLHPQIAHQRKGELPLFERLISETRYVGEIGLDSAPEFKRHWDEQMHVFTRALDICRAAGGRVLSLHSHRAATAMRDALEARPGVGTPILHWFPGTSREFARAIDLGCWFSVGPGMLCGEKGRELARRMPRDRLLTESDGPFARIDGRGTWPWEVANTVAELVKLWDEPQAAVESALARDLTRLGKQAGAADRS
jgi:TatD DNase family protein